MLLIQIRIPRIRDFSGNRFRIRILKEQYIDQNHQKSYINFLREVGVSNLGHTTLQLIDFLIKKSENATHMIIIDILLSQNSNFFFISLGVYVYI